MPRVKASAARVVTIIALLVSGTVAIVIPAGYFTVAYSGVDASLRTKAEVKATGISALVAASPDVWRFQEHRLQELLVRRPVHLDNEMVRILYKDGTVVAETEVDVRWPFLSRTAPIFDAGHVAGTLEIRRSLNELALNTLIAALLAFGLAIAMFLTLRTLPLRALNRTTDALVREKERAIVTLDSIGDAVITTDPLGHIETLNPVAEKLTGWTEAEAKGRLLAEVFVLVNELTGNSVEHPLHQALTEKRIVPLANHTALVRRDGSRVPVEDSAAPILGIDGTLLGGVLVFRDVSAARESAERLSWQASHDALTGLFNRKEFDRRLEDALRSARAQAKSHALCYIDLDQFKVVNDTCGHAAGDELLKQISLLLQSKVRASDTLARLGGDEFGVLLENCPLDKAQEVAGQLLEKIRTFRFTWVDKVFSVSASIGIAAVTESSTNPQRVLSIADTACYSAKEGGRNRVHVFRYGDAELTARGAQMEWISRLTRALEANSFCLYGQPYLALSGGTSTSVHIELLLRLVGTGGEIIAPGLFVPAAERYNLMPAVDRWVVSHAFQAHRELSGKFGPSAVFSINLSGTSLSGGEFAEFVMAQARRHGVPPQAICFEITETAAINQLSAAAAFVRALKGEGFRFALDDFGVGMSSFGYLKNLPVDYLKIDGSFVKDICTDPTSRSMVAAMNEIGHTMGLTTVAEFVDSAESLQVLRSIGVDYAQGFFVSKPQPLSQMLARAPEDKAAAG